ncbi:hypothetical protein AB1Y20_023214 [Prymnesium parvum]|uniref:Uncharacterized protein n=1 Tax=Prymnesium parvum TaxID=97485 RepID=A0AB34JD95_PRYPA
MDASSSGGPGPIMRASSRSQLRHQSSKPYVRIKGASQEELPHEAGSGLTNYVADMQLSFDEGMGARQEAGAKDAVPSAALSERGSTSSRRRSSLGKKKSRADEEMELVEGDGTSRRSLGRALSSLRQAKPTVKEVDIWKEDKEAVLGMTLQLPVDESLQGVVVAEIHPGCVVARSKKLRVGDVIHAVNGQPVGSPKHCAQLLREAKGVIQLSVSRVNAKPREPELSPEAAQPQADTASKDEQAARRSSKSFLPKSLPSLHRKSKLGAREEEEPATHTTVVVSCSQLILESKKIIGSHAGLDAQLDALYKTLKAKEMSSQAALQNLIQLVGQTTVEQAGLVIANLHSGTLPGGWVEYFDKETGRCYYYNVHTKTTTWYKPRKDKPPPPMPLAGPSTRRSTQRSPRSSLSRDSGTNTEHGVAEAISAMQTKKKMVETVQLECSLAPWNGAHGLVSVSL